MKKVFLLLALCLCTYLFSTCGKSVKPIRYRYIGDIYNVADSTPFRNTKFKIWRRRDGFSKEDDTHYFYTDSVGHFNTVADFGGSVCWPSYYWGTGYFGPQPPNADSFWSDYVDKMEEIGYYKIYYRAYY
jgi:hypothetical protein